MKQLFILLIGISFIFGCAHVVSEEGRNSADPSISLQLLFENPLEYEGKIVILGGTVIRSFNKQEGTYIEVIEKSLDYRGRPKKTDQSLGRFLIFYDGYLETALFSKGRGITVAGEVMGTKVDRLGEIDYTYPLIKSREVHALKPGQGFPISIGIGILHSF